MRRDRIFEVAGVSDERPAGTPRRPKEPAVAGKAAVRRSVFADGRPQLGDAHPRVHAYRVNLARVRIARGDSAAVEPALRAVLEARQQLYPPGDWRIAQAQSLLAASFMAQKRYAQAETLMLAADEGLKPIPGIQDRERAANRARLATLRRMAGRPQPAAVSR
jgi:hypothetical protein